ncbi:hypothetical protein PKOR_04040 [Pontibacter korlensis]|uniref:Uncharacterized protein n=1 Tax=Pontibacter korlensis TaxID=400092 RepID=A0A0E3UW70_9BACT|nr:hypothetical protein PKOR_04040 [Pontibacter korlensis]
MSFSCGRACGAGESSYFCIPFRQGAVQWKGLRKKFSPGACKEGKASYLCTPLQEGGGPVNTACSGGGDEKNFLKVLAEREKVLTFAAASSLRSPSRKGGKKSFERCLGIKKSFLPLQPASQREALRDAAGRAAEKERKKSCEKVWRFG